MKKIILGITVLLSVISITSCDKDFNTIGSEIVGGNHFDLDRKDDFTVVAYSKATGSVQTNNLPINALGIYDNPAFGLTKASFVSQVELSTSSFNIGDTPVIDSVYLYVPYFSTLESTDTNGNRVFELDSVYGYDENAKFDLKVLENGYRLRDYDPLNNFQSAQKYYSNEKSSKIDPYKGVELLNNSSNTAQNTNFVISNKEIIIYKTNGSGVYLDENNVAILDQNDASLRIVKERKTPGMWLDLKNSFFQQKILDQADTGVLYNNSTFKDFFRGLLFEVSETSPGRGSMAMLDFSRAEFKILYKSTFSGGTPTRYVYSLQMGYNASSFKTSNSISLIEHTKQADYAAGLSASNETTGDSRLYLKGNDGSVAFIELFGNTDVFEINADGVMVSGSNGVPDELDQLRVNNWLINEANLVFYIDTSADFGMGKANQIEPERIYIFDATNNNPIIDYYADGSTSSDVKRNKRGFGGIIQRDGITEKGIRYKVKLTEYINRLVNSKIEDYRQNVRIGVSITENINSPQNAYINPGNLITIGGSQVEFLPVSSAMSPLGTILHGSTSTSTYTDSSGNIIPMKLKLQIYYTEPTN
ncbi:DUF4270 domain-containing protein [Flavobacterium sp.]|jgi:hypothetical protein|uniref:DUF4270 domain-containing protein n=1 Tax=Flavobacterium sp. TaxID=239 RepID=UPI002A80DA9F|nr:DUF4270 domain-containing protein [Flavobacterium sp.]